MEIKLDLAWDNDRPRGKVRDNEIECIDCQTPDLFSLSNSIGNNVFSLNESML
jgi:hypothetical protein